MDAEDYLLKIPLMTKKKNTLADVRSFMLEMGNPDDQMKIIHVAGTNGKGSVCAYMTAELVRQGYRVGTFISPHLVCVRERLLLDGQPADIVKFQETFDCLKPLVDCMVKKGYQHPSFFEYLFLLAMKYYKHNPVDYLILETGLGGRLDVTNVVKRPLLTVITSISLDHTQYLGNTITAIASEKAGIIKAGCPLVYDGNQPVAAAVIKQRAETAASPAYPVMRPNANEQEPFCAPYQAMNAALACQALELLALPGWERQEAYHRLSLVRWPGRMEEIRPDIWLDGAHNEGGVRAFTEAAARIQKRNGKQIHLLFATVADKDYSQMIALICDRLPLGAVTIARLNQGRAADNQKLETEFRKYLTDVPIRAFENSGAALDWALALKTDGDLLFVAGSLYLLGEIKAIMEEQNDKF